MRSMWMLTNVRRFVPRVNSAPSVAASKIAIWEPSTIAMSGAINAITVRSKNSVRVPGGAGELWSSGYATIWSNSGAEK